MDEAKNSGELPDGVRLSPDVVVPPVADGRPFISGVFRYDDPPVMTVCFRERPRRYITIRMRSEIGDEDPYVVASRELASFTDDQITLLSESAVVVDDNDFGDESDG